MDCPLLEGAQLQQMKAVTRPHTQTLTPFDWLTLNSGAALKLESGCGPKNSNISMMISAGGSCNNTGTVNSGQQARVCCVISRGFCTWINQKQLLLLLTFSY